jgi:hypothetical protein
MARGKKSTLEGMDFVLRIELDNDVFNGVPEIAHREVARILTVAAAKVGTGMTEFSVMDVNGNRVGGAEIHTRHQQLGLNEKEM